MVDHPVFDVIIVGGSFAGIAAALPLVRARRKVAVIDAGLRRNRFTHASHGFLGQDGRAPGDIIADAKAQLLAYPDVTWVQGSASRASTMATGFAVTMESGEILHSRKLILATGIVDEMLDIPGFGERWGRGIYTCPYCDGYELNRGHIGVIAVDETSIHQAIMLCEWGQVTLFLNGALVLDEGQQGLLTSRGVSIESAPIEEIQGETPVIKLRDGRLVPVAGIFSRCRTHLASPLADQLGCVMDEGMSGPYIRTNEGKETTVPGVFGCGDAIRMMHSVTFAVSDGFMAGISVHRSLMLG